MRQTISVVLPILTAALVVGVLVGKHYSWDSANPKTAHIFFARHAKWEPLDGERGKLTLQAGSQILSYTTGDTSVSTRYYSAIEMSQSPMPTVNLDADKKELISLAIAPPVASGILSKFVFAGPEAETLPKNQLFVLGVITAGTFALGFELGRITEPDYENKVFQDTLKNDVALWSQYESDFRRVFTLLVMMDFKNRPECINKEAPIAIMGRMPPPKRFLSLHPELQEEARQEVDSLCKVSRLPQESDRIIPTLTRY
jgi:hypothetical protein